MREGKGARAAAARTRPPYAPPPHPAVILTGGGSLLEGLSKRLYWETLTLVPAAFKPRILTAAPREREVASWVGASVLASLGTFQQMWISKAEYQEVGSHVIDKYT